MSSPHSLLPIWDTVDKGLAEVRKAIERAQAQNRQDSRTIQAPPGAPEQSVRPDKAA